MIKGQIKGGIKGRTMFGFEHTSVKCELYVVRESKKTKLLVVVASGARYTHDVIVSYLM